MIDSLSEAKLITGILPKGKGIPIAELLKSEKGISASNVASGRGMGMVRSISYGEWSEVDILTVVAEAERADEIFDFIYRTGRFGEKGQGFRYQTPLTRATSFALPQF